MTTETDSAAALRAALTCPACGSTDIATWYYEPHVRAIRFDPVNGHAVTDTGQFSGDYHDPRDDETAPTFLGCLACNHGTCGPSRDLWKLPPECAGLVDYDADKRLEELRAAERSGAHLHPAVAAFYAREWCAEAGVPPEAATWRAFLWATGGAFDCGEPAPAGFVHVERDDTADVWASDAAYAVQVAPGHAYYWHGGTGAVYPIACACAVPADFTDGGHGGVWCVTLKTGPGTEFDEWRATQDAVDPTADEHGPAPLRVCISTEAARAAGLLIED